MTMIDPDQKVLVTSDCPICGAAFSREHRERWLVVGLVLELCPRCVDGNQTILCLSQRWENPSSQT